MTGNEKYIILKKKTRESKKDKVDKLDEIHKRWYDVDPTVSLAVSLIRNTNDQTQLKCADFIIANAKKNDVKVKANSLNDAFNYIMRRWYDKNIKVSHAMEYLKNCPIDIRKELALEIIDFIKEYKDYEKNLK